MRHGISQRKLSRKSGHRTAMFRNMSAALIKHEQILTTLPKAKELRPYVEKLITLAKRGGLSNRRLAMGRLQDETQLKKLFDVLAERYAEVGEPDTALRVYDGVVRTCTDVDILIATLEKAAAYADPNELGDLADAARGQVPSAESRIDQVEDRLRAGLGAPAINTSSAPGTIPLPRTGAAEGGRVATSSAVAAPAPSVSVTAAPAMSLRPVRRPADLDALLTAPAIARQRGSTPSAPVTSARASSSGGSGVLARARSAAERGDWRGCVSATSGSQQADVVAQRGWCVMNIGRPMQALADFRRAASSASTARARIVSPLSSTTPWARPFSAITSRTAAPVRSTTPRSRQQAAIAWVIAPMPPIACPQAPFLPFTSPNR